MKTAWLTLFLSMSPLCIAATITDDFSQVPEEQASQFIRALFDDYTDGDRVLQSPSEYLEVALTALRSGKPDQISAATPILLFIVETTDGIGFDILLDTIDVTALKNAISVAAPRDRVKLMQFLLSVNPTDVDAQDMAIRLLESNPYDPSRITEPLSRSECCTQNQLVTLMATAMSPNASSSTAKAIIRLLDAKDWYTEEMYEVVWRVLSSPRTFANSHMLEMLPRMPNREESVRRVTDLISVLDEEYRKPSFFRKISIYNYKYSKQKIQSTLAELSSAP